MSLVCNDVTTFKEILKIGYNSLTLTFFKIKHHIYLSR
jgi:hypothetical protein